MTGSRELAPLSAALPAPSRLPDAPQRPGVGRTMAVGIVVVFLFFGGFGIWSTFAPLESASIAQGVIAVSGQRKTVQHLEGGLVADILVAEGETVAAGQPLVVLDDTPARATVADLVGKRRSETALKARLEAERDGLREVGYPEWLREAVAEDGSSILATQDRIFEARARSLANRASIYDRRIAQLQEEAGGLDEEAAALERQIALLTEERDVIRPLAEKGVERRSRLRAIERALAEVEGRRARIRALSARAGQRIGEARLAAEELANERLNEVVGELREVETRLSELGERLRAARDVLARTRVPAPVAGTVVDLRIFTRGGVVGRGQPLMDIVPAGGALVIEAQVRPTDIDTVHPGLPAQVRLTAFSQLSTPVLSGTVLKVSADRLVDEHTGTPYYRAEVVLDPEQPELANLALQPGMPAEIMIVTGKTSAVDYLLKPILTSLRRALREE